MLMKIIKLIIIFLVACLPILISGLVFANGGGYYNIWHVGLKLKTGESMSGYVVLHIWDVPSEAAGVSERNRNHTILKSLKSKGDSIELLHHEPFSIANIGNINLEESLSIGLPEFFYIGNENSRRKISLEDIVSFSDSSFQKPLVFHESWPGSMPFYGIAFVEDKLYYQVRGQRKRDILAWGFGGHKGFKHFLISYDGYQPVNLAEVLTNRKFEDKEFLIKNGIIYINYFEPVFTDSEMNKIINKLT